MPDVRRRKGVNVILVAEEAAGVQTLRAILKTRHRILGVVTSADALTHRGATVRGVAEAAGCPIWPATTVRDPRFGDRLREAGVEVLLTQRGRAVRRSPDRSRGIAGACYRQLQSASGAVAGIFGPQRTELGYIQR